MTQTGSTAADPIPIGDIAKPPFVRLPDPSTMFARRAERLRSLADGNALARLSDLSRRSERHSTSPRRPVCPHPDRRPPPTCARAGQFGMPPLDRSAFTRDAAFDESWRPAARAGRRNRYARECARLALERVGAADATRRQP